MTSGFLNVFLSDRVGFGIVSTSAKESIVHLTPQAAPFGTSMQALAYCLILWGPPFPLFVLSYLLNGFGLGLQDAQVNSLIVRFPDPNVKMFLLHAFYGLGATISPLVSTEFVKKEPNRVYLYFAVSLGLAAFIIALLLVVFRLRTEDQIVGKREVVQSETTTETSEMEGSGDKMKRILRTPAVHAMAFYLMIYVGVEVTLGGWIVSLMIRSDAE
jgi:fucose permease